MKQNEEQGEGSVGYKGAVAPGPTMQGTDVLFPQIGEIIGGSVREESYDKLMGEINRRQMDMTHLWWYLDTRRWGSCPHAGFGLGFERLILFVTGMQNIRDVIKCTLRYLNMYKTLGNMITNYRIIDDSVHIMLVKIRPGQID